VERLGLNYPVLVRIAGDHGGKSMLKIDEPVRMEGTLALFKAEMPLYVTEFREYADADGLYRKHRLVVVGDQVFVRHVLIAEDWLLHAAKRDERFEAEEAARVRHFDETIAPLVAPKALAIADRLMLDYLGVDCHVAPDGSLLVFEANACMDILLNHFPSPNVWDEVRLRIRAALQDLLADPSRWRASITPEAFSV
jgi:hypothetical protein